jgi:hypothetical protein
MLKNLADSGPNLGGLAKASQVPQNRKIRTEPDLNLLGKSGGVLLSRASSALAGSTMAPMDVSPPEKPLSSCQALHCRLRKLTTAAIRP